MTQKATHGRIRLVHYHLGVILFLAELSVGDSGSEEVAQFVGSAGLTTEVGRWVV